MRFLTGGESHGPCVTAILEGIPAGLAGLAEAIDRDLVRRQSGYGRGGRMQIESDRVEILGGVISGRTTGAPIVLRIENRDWENWRDLCASGELPPLTVPRPGHADWAGMAKYAMEDARPILERASARETAARVAVGAVAKCLLTEFGIRVGSAVTSIGEAQAPTPKADWDAAWEQAERSSVRCADAEATQRMTEAIDAAREAGDSLGGTFLVAATGVPPGLGSHVHWDRRLDARIAEALISIPAIKGVEIGPAFDNARRRGTVVHDAFVPANGGVTRPTNRAGGLEGGISNGEAIVVRAAMKPIPTTIAPQPSVDLSTGGATEIEYQRSDVCAVPAAAVVGEAMLAWTLADALCEKLGGDSLDEMKAHEGAWHPRG